jgi:translation initiation factor IF-2
MSNAGSVRAYGLTVEVGTLHKNSLIRLLRNDKIIEENMKLAALRHFKKEVTEIKEGNDCGLSFVQPYQIIKGDVIECYKTEQ